MPPKPDILVLGLGQPLLTDDTAGLGIVTGAAVRFAAEFPRVVFSTYTGGGFDLLPVIAGYARLLVVDSIRTERAPSGHCHVFHWRALSDEADAGWFSQHGLNWPQLLAAGRVCGFALPEEILFFGVEGRDFHTFAEQPTEEIVRAFPSIVEKIGGQLRTWYAGPRTALAQGALG
jgi:hydrogenase maturation protease